MWVFLSLFLSCLISVDFIKRSAYKLINNELHTVKYSNYCHCHGSSDWVQQAGAHTAKINVKWRFIAALQQKWKSSCTNILSMTATTECRIQERQRYKHKHNDNNVYKMHMAIRILNVIWLWTYNNCLASSTNVIHWFRITLDMVIVSASRLPFELDVISLQFFFIYSFFIWKHFFGLWTILCTQLVWMFHSYEFFSKSHFQSQPII